MKTKNQIKKEIEHIKSLINKEQDSSVIFTVNFVRRMIIAALEWAIDED